MVQTLPQKGHFWGEGVQSLKVQGFGVCLGPTNIYLSTVNWVLKLSAIGFAKLLGIFIQTYFPTMWFAIETDRDQIETSMKSLVKLNAIFTFILLLYCHSGELFFFQGGGFAGRFFEVFFRNIFSGSIQKYVMCIFKTSVFPRRIF